MKKYENTGFTLVELLIAIAISSTVLLAAVAIFNSQSRMKKTHDQLIETQQNLRSAMFLLEHDLKMAGYRGRELSVTAGFISPCNATTMTFQYVADNDKINNDSDTDTDETGEKATIRYELFADPDDNDGIPNDLGRTENGKQVCIAKDIENLEFYYALAVVDPSTGKKKTEYTTDPTSIPGAAASNIRSVTVSLLAKSRKPVKMDTSYKYTSKNNQNWDSPNDGFLRRFAQSTVICRNLINI